MTDPGRPAGLLLVRGSPNAVAAWAYRGQVGVDVVPLGQGWTGVLPVGLISAVAPPYHDAVAMLFNRDVPTRLRPAIGVAVAAEVGLVAVSPRRWRAIRRWAAWTPGVGLTRPAHLPLAPLSAIVSASGATVPGTREDLKDVLTDRAGDARSVLVDVLTVLGLPGGALFEGSTTVTSVRGVVRVDPSDRRVAGFETVAREERSWREEVEEQQ
ncbi:MAG TPA: hypothetical protein VHM65_08255 [Candidatus Lustribacter sp.]|nr:hypothetical protein [Candidatus Lustribacter sp.]